MKGRIMTTTLSADRLEALANDEKYHVELVGYRYYTKTIERRWRLTIHDVYNDVIKNFNGKTVDDVLTAAETDRACQDMGTIPEVQHATGRNVPDADEPQTVLARGDSRAVATG
jgi:hypothetical protein